LRELPKTYSEWLEWLLDREDITQDEYEEAMKALEEEMKIPVKEVKQIVLPDLPSKPQYLVKRRGFTYVVVRDSSGRFAKWVRRV